MKRNRGYYKQFYTSTSEARSLNSISAQSQLARKKETKQPVKMNKSTLREAGLKQKTKYVDVGKTKVGISICHSITVGLVFLCTLGAVFLSCLLWSANKTNETYNVKLQKNRIENMNLQAELAQKFDLTEVEQIAINRLGMSKPKPYQVIHFFSAQENYLERK